MSTTPTVLTILSKSKSKTSILCFKTEQQCPIQNVTVYHDRAEVTRLLEYHFDVEGTYALILEGFAPFADSTSLHV
ncbi:unnamed protein product, partial [Rotaria magnacalcarata]